MIYRADGRARVYKRRHERFVTNCVEKVDRFAGGNVMWAAIPHTGRTDLVHVNSNLMAQKYCDEIPHQHIVPIMQNNGRIFQHNARPLTDLLQLSFRQTTLLNLKPSRSHLG